MRLLAAAAIFACLASGQEVQRPRILGVAHIALYAHDIEQSRAFYTGMLGFQEPYSLKNPDGSLSMTFFKINDHQYVELFPEKAPKPTAWCTSRSKPITPNNCGHTWLRAASRCRTKSPRAASATPPST